MDIRTLKKIYSKLSKQEKVELALVQELERNAETAKGQLRSLQNLAARMEYNYRKIEDMADKVGVELNSKTIEAGKFFRDLENKLK
jgi:hypothetical protein